MNLDNFYIICYVWLAIAVVVHVTMFYVKAPFGRHTSDKWGPLVNNKMGWMIMELVSFLMMVYFLVFGSQSFNSYVWIIFSLWIFHYFNRTFVYPLRIKPTAKRMPLFIFLNAILFNLMNAGLNGYYLSELAPASDYGTDWLYNPRTWIGGLIFIVGLAINWRADHILINLRKPGETGYKIPHKFLFKYVSSPNLFGEVLEWTGFAIMAWNLPAFTFMIWTSANLIPRAKNHHDWYHEKFPEYPKKRKVIIPGIY